MGEAKRRKQLDPNFGKVRQPQHNSSSPFYAIFHPVKEDFLCKVEETQYVERIQWNKHPSRAMKFPSEEAAEKQAHKLAQQKEAGYELVVCRIDDVGEQLRVEELGRVRKVDSLA